MTVSDVQDVSFRRAKKEDLAAIVELLADDSLGATREKPEPPLDASYIKAFEAIDRDPNQLLVVVERDGALLGCLQLTFIPGLSRTGMWRGQIESVRIASSFRGEGLGGVMFRWAIEKCKERNCGLVQLTTDKARPDALRFYEALGFRASHEGMKLPL
ncbi:GNAT family N-acetyltransferase [Denitrobaculum tricleocarpae]|uniref:GNAT family N-acetyltransferase n=1 Tax=Denitrobaculum tricleocarpae TaxID=2591009 RepID=A0A545TQ33_9PROT|nr:GNAT family N-acetyltransferase [Denitrobaculum tricleocarpae]TQV79337.1 GNAT family N-acetyltransferase [Denitrobaculum tricleocarpae]